jgi:hypothetical protein
MRFWSVIENGLTDGPTTKAMSSLMLCRDREGLRSGHLAAEGRTVFEARRGPRASVKAPLGAARERRQGTSPTRIVIYELPDRPLADFRKTAENGCVLGCQGRIEGL